MRLTLILVLALVLSSAPCPLASPALTNNKLTVDLNSFEATVEPAILSEPGYVTVSLDKAPASSEIDIKLTSEAQSFLTKNVSTTIKDRGFKVWVDVPWNGPGSSGKYNLTVTLDGIDYVIDPWWNLTWYESQKLCFDTLTTGITQHLVDFPVMVRLDSTRLNWTDIQADGDDLRFIDADNVTVLSYEIERYTYNSEAIVWVRVPQIDANSTTDHIWMYYDNPAAASGEDAGNVWTTDAVMVQHMDDATNSTILDSTSYDNDGAKKAVDEPIETASGEIDAAQSFDGTDDYIQVPNSATLKNFTSMSLTMWIKMSAFTGVNQYIVDGGYWAVPYGYLLYTAPNSNSIYSIFKNTTGTAAPLTTITYTPNTWTQIGWVWDGTNAYSIKNGALLAGVAFSGTMDPTANIRLGSRLTGTNPYNGSMDEVRVYDDARSLSEVKGDYYTGLDTFISYDQPWTGVTLNIENSVGDPVPDALINIFQHEALIATRLGRADGTFHYPLDAGNYVIYVAADGYTTGSTSVTVAGAYVAETVTLAKPGGGMGMLGILGVFAVAAAAGLGGRRR